MTKINRLQVLFLIVTLSLLGFENIIVGQQLSSPVACIKGHRDKMSLTKEQILDAGEIEVYIRNYEITINVLRFSMSCIGHSSRQDSTGNFSEKQIGIIKKAPKGTKIYFGDIIANIGGQKHFLAPFHLKVK